MGFAAGETALLGSVGANLEAGLLSLSFALLIGLMIFATWNDLAQLGVVRWVSGLLG